MESTKNSSIKILVGVVVIALAGFGIWQLNKENKAAVVEPETPSNADSVATNTPEVQPSNQAQPASTYQNGTYSVEGNYRSPEGAESIGVTLTISNDVVTAADITVLAEDGTSKRYQNLFKSGFATYVVGKNIDSISLGVINGASLTPKGFNDALVKIKAEAQA